MLFTRCRREAIKYLGEEKSNELCKVVLNLASLDSMIEQVRSRARLNETKEELSNKLQDVLTGEMVNDLRKRVGAANFDASEFLSDITARRNACGCAKVCLKMGRSRR